MVKSAERAATLIKLLADHPNGLLFSDIEKRLALPKSSLHDLLDTLVATHLACYDTDTKCYRLGPLVWEAAMAFSRNLQLVPLALPHLDRLSRTLGETVQMAVRDGADIVYIAKSESRHPVQLISSVGSRLPAHATGLGKALLACLSDHHLDQLYPNLTSLPALSPHTISDLSALKVDLDRTRMRGYAIDAGECTPGLTCLATPILDGHHKPVAAISVSIPHDRYATHNPSAMAEDLRKEANALARTLGASDPGSWQRQENAPF